MKKLIVTLVAATVLSVTGAKAWQVDVNVGDVSVSAGDGYVDVYTPHGYGGGSWYTKGGYHPTKYLKKKKIRRSNKKSGAKLYKINHRRLKRR